MRHFDPALAEVILVEAVGSEEVDDGLGLQAFDFFLAMAVVVVAGEDDHEVADERGILHLCGPGAAPFLRRRVARRLFNETRLVPRATGLISACPRLPLNFSTSSRFFFFS